MIQMHQFARWLDRDAFQIEFAMPGGGPMPESLAAMGETVHAVELGSRFSLRDVRRLARLCRERRIDVLHSHNVRANIHARVAGRMASVPARVSTIHNSVYHYDVSAVHKHLYSAAERLTLRWCNRVIAVSEGIALELRSRYQLRPEKISVVPNGVDPGRLEARVERAQVREQLGIGDEAIVLLQVGRLTPQKGYDVLFEAVARIADRYRELVVLAVGEGPLRDDLASQAQSLGIANVVHFLGHREDVADLLQAADLVTLASRSEGMPYTLLEAMGSGRAVVATRIGGIEEVITQAGMALLVPSEDPEALANSLVTLLEDPEGAEKMGRAAREYILQHHSAAGMLAQVQTIYRDLLAGAPSR
jgi:glycosyltransferase involved in cell wall biosynthesis